MTQSPFDRSLEVLAATPAVLQSVVANLPSSADRPSAEAWSPTEVLAHLLQSETQSFTPRIQQALNSDAAPPRPMPEAASADATLASWLAARTANLEWLPSVTPDQRARMIQHPRFGEITVETYVVEWAYHDLDHLRQILSSVSVELYPHIGPFQPLYTPPS